MARIWKNNKTWILTAIVVIVVAVFFYVLDMLTIGSRAHASEKPTAAEFMRLARLYANKPHGAFVIRLKDIEMNNGFYDVRITYARTRPHRLVISLVDFTPTYSFRDQSSHIEARYSRVSGLLTQVPTAFIDDGSDGKLDRLITIYRLESLPFRISLTPRQAQSYYDGVVSELMRYLRHLVATT